MSVISVGRRPASKLVSAVALAAALAAPSASAAEPSRPSWTRQFLQHSVTLATLTQVQQELKLTPEQKSQVDELEAKRRDERRAIFQRAAGDLDAMAQGIAQLNASLHEELRAILDEPQGKRMQEIYLQTNDLLALQDEAVVAELKLTDEQQTRLRAAIDEARRSMFASFQEFQGMSREEIVKKQAELAATRDQSYDAVLTDEQRQRLAELKGEPLAIDLSKLPSPFGR